MQFHRSQQGALGQCAHRYAQIWDRKETQQDSLLRKPSRTGINIKFYTHIMSNLFVLFAMDKKGLKKSYL